MAVAQLNTTTLTQNITSLDNEFTVNATTNIVAGSAGTLIAIASKSGTEVCKVQAIPASGRVQVLRGIGGTRARAHANGALVYIGTPDQFKAIKDNAAAVVGDSGFLPDYCLPGTRARDGAGNEYVLVDLTFSAFAGATVLIDRMGTFTAAALANGNAGSVGVVVEEGTSNQYAWAQIYGALSGVQLVGGSSLVTSTGIFQPASSVSTPAVGLLGRTTSQASSEFGTRVFGMYPTSACTTATTSATSATGFACSVWMNYPFVERQPSS